MVFNQRLVTGLGFYGALHLPTRARADQAQVGEAKIEHSARHRADIFTQLGANKNNCRRQCGFSFHLREISQRRAFINAGILLYDMQSE